MDPPRKEAVEAVAECHNGGIRVTMITGDHKITAAAIAKMLGIGDGKTAVAGAEIEEMNDGALQETVRNVDVFARASPEHKLRLVKAIQANGQVVAMTGDGVNDAPALKRADIGVAMGIKGTEVTKEAAAMVLADDNFASITAAVREGRTVYNNIEKALLFMLPTNVAQALVILVAIVVGFILPITAPQILWVNMVTSVALGLVISFEPHEHRRDAASPARGVATDTRRLRDMAGHLCWSGAACPHPVGVLLDEVARRRRRTCARRRSQYARHRPGLLSAQQPLQDGFVAVDRRASWQPLCAARRRRGHHSPASVHLCAAAAAFVRRRGHSPGCLAVAVPRRLGVLPHRRGGEIRHSRLSIQASLIAGLGTAGRVPFLWRSNAPSRKPHRRPASAARPIGSGRWEGLRYWA